MVPSGAAEVGQRVPQGHGLDAWQGAAGEEHAVGELAEADEHDGQAQAADVLVGTEGHRHQRHQGTGDEAHHDGAQQADQGVARLIGHGEAEEGPRVHRALDAQVEHAGALGVGLAHGAVHERRGVAEGGRDDIGEEHHVGGSSTGAAPSGLSGGSSGSRLTFIGRPVVLAGGAPAVDGHRAHDHQQERALHDIADLAGDLQRAHRGGGAHAEVAQQQSGDQHARHGQAAEHGHHHAGVAEAGRDALGQAELDARDLADTGHAGDGARDEGHAQERALHLDAGEAGTVR